MPASVSTWTLFTGSDLALAVIGLIGLLSVVVVFSNARAQSNAADS